MSRCWLVVMIGPCRAPSSRPLRRRRRARRSRPGCCRRWPRLRSDFRPSLPRRCPRYLPHRPIGRSFPRPLGRSPLRFAERRPYHRRRPSRPPGQQRRPRDCLRFAIRNHKPATLLLPGPRNVRARRVSGTGQGYSPANISENARCLAACEQPAEASARGPRKLADLVTLD
jgi:hypothetical protein